MFWRKKEQTKPALDDPRTQTRTTTAQRESTHTSTENRTFFDDITGTTTFSTTQQTVVHQEQVGEKIRTTRRTATEEEIQAMLRVGPMSGMNLDGRNSLTVAKTHKNTVKQSDGCTITMRTEQHSLHSGSDNGVNVRSSFKRTDAKPATSTQMTPSTPYVSPYMNRLISNPPTSVHPSNSTTGVGIVLAKNPMPATAQRATSDARPYNLPISTPTTSSFSKSASIPTMSIAAKPTTTTKLKPGVVYILHNLKFSDKKIRRGSEKDVENLKRVFEKFKLEVKCYDDPKIKRVKEIGQDIKSRNFSKHSCVVIVILSHGHRHEMILAQDGEYNIDNELLFPMQENPTLQNKPKIFFIQACKGDYHATDSSPKSMVIPNTKLKESKKSAPIEILKCYSTFEGYVSYRDEEKGSYFIQELCIYLERFGKSYDIRTIMDKVINSVIEKSERKQAPSYTYSFTKPFTFGDYCN